MIANLMHVAGVNHVITIDLHASQMQGFFKGPVDNLIAEPLLAKWIKGNVPNWRDAVVVSKNPGGTKRVTSLADALKLSFGIVTTDRRRPHAGNSMAGSVIFESMGTDGLNEVVPAEEEEFSNIHESHSRKAPHSIEQDFARMSTSNGTHGSRGDDTQRPSGRFRAASNLAPGVRSRLVNSTGDFPSSPLAKSTRADSADQSPEPELASSQDSLPKTVTGPGAVQPPPDEDGYEDPPNDEFADEVSLSERPTDRSKADFVKRARDVITGRLIHGHIVDDDFPSPYMSAMSASMMQHSQHNLDDDPPDHMLSSFMSTASSHRAFREPGLGGTGDATASDDEEEEILQNPEVESMVTLVGNVRGKPVLILDDIMDKPGSWIAAAETVVKRGGATHVYCMATHGLFGGDSLQELDDCDEIDGIVVTNAFPIPEEKKRGIRKLIELDVSNLLAEAIRRNHYGESISQLYQSFD